METVKALTYKNGQVRFKGMNISLWDFYGLSKYEFRAGSFNEDSRGRWYLNVVVKYPTEVKPVQYGASAIGREWTCSNCGAVHDRDTNAAKNILAAGLRRLAEGIPAL